MTVVSILLYVFHHLISSLFILLIRKSKIISIPPSRLKDPDLAMNCHMHQLFITITDIDLSLSLSLLHHWHTKVAGMWPSGTAHGCSREFSRQRADFPRQRRFETSSDQLYFQLFENSTNIDH